MKTFVEANVEIIDLNNDDVIVTSSGCCTGPNDTIDLG